MDVSAPRCQQSTLQEAFEFVFEANFIVRHGPTMNYIQHETHSRGWQSSHVRGKLVSPVGQIPAEQFVRAFSTKSDCCCPLAHSRKEPNRQGSRICIWLVGVIAKFLNGALQI